MPRIWLEGNLFKQYRNRTLKLDAKTKPDNAIAPWNKAGMIIWIWRSKAEIE
jgi:hypothetical protein